jgi:hypothetical protein
LASGAVDKNRKIIGAAAMTIWAVQDRDGQILPHFLGSSRIQLGCKLLPARYDEFRLHVSASYRELFDRALRQVLEQNRWQITEITHRKWSRGSCKRRIEDDNMTCSYAASVPETFATGGTALGVSAR